MVWVFDLLYMLTAVLGSPIWILRMARAGKLRTDWRARLGRIPALPAARGPRILLHGVSVGEVNALRMLAEQLTQRTHGGLPIEVVVATTTDTGFSRTKSLFPQTKVVRYPFDFSWSVRRFLRAVRPDVVALVELEVWPNFTATCARRGIPVCVINGRLTERSLRRYARVSALIRSSFRRLAFAAVQTVEYAERFRRMGVQPDRILVTGTMKWDTAQIADEVPGALQLAEEMGIDRGKPLIVAGSTAPGEHELLQAAVPSDVQLLCAPRKPEWFDQAATVLNGCARRSRGDRGSTSGRFLLDTIGELRQAYALADIVVVGRSFGELHGSDMMEPVALDKATVVGPAVSDFQDAMSALLEGGGAIQTTPEKLPEVLRELLDSPQQRVELAARGRAVIRSRQGATAKHADLVVSLLPASPDRAMSDESKNPPPRQSRGGSGGERRKVV